MASAATVFDASGKSIGEAKVTLIDEGAEDAARHHYGAEGGFSFSQVVPATYTVVVEAPGFKKFERKHVPVGTQEFVSLDLKMEIGSVSESVQVTEEVPLIESTNASQGQVLERQQLIDLPNLGRNPFMMSKLAQNVTPVGDPHYNRMEDQSGSSQISIAGGPVRGNNYLLDGIPITDAANRAIIIPTLEAVEQVKIQSNTYDAEMARTGGGMFNTYLKSGTNDYHGSLFGSLRRTSWAANNFFNNAAGIPLPQQPNYTFGASFGGPITHPAMCTTARTAPSSGWRGKATTIRNRTRRSSPTPTALERVGNFSQSKTPSGALNVIYDPTEHRVRRKHLHAARRLRATSSPRPVEPNRSGHCGDICQSADALGLLRRAEPDAGRDAGGARLAEDREARSSVHQLVAQQPELSALLLAGTRQQLVPDGFVARPVGVAAARGHHAVQQHHDDLADHGSDRALRLQPLPELRLPAEPGLQPGEPGLQPRFHRAGSLAHVSQRDHDLAVQPGDQQQLLLRASLEELLDRPCEVSGPPQSEGRLRLSPDSRRRQRFRQQRRRLHLQRRVLAIHPATAVAGTGADLADMLLGTASAGTGYIPTKLYEYADYYGAYFQDDIRMTKTLTVNLGVRWEREYGLQEKNNSMVVGFDTKSVNPLAANVTGILPKGVIQFAGVNGNSIHVSNPNMNKMAPRIGLAWQFDSKTTIRGGYGLYWAPQFAIGTPYNPPGFTATTS